MWGLIIRWGDKRFIESSSFQISYFIEGKQNGSTCN